MSGHSNASWKIAVAAVVIASAAGLLFAQGKPATAMAAAHAHGNATAAISEGDSRANDYRLERDSVGGKDD